MNYYVPCFETLYLIEDRSVENIRGTATHMLNRDISLWQVEIAVKQLKSSEALCIDFIHIEVYKQGDDKLLKKEQGDIWDAIFVLLYMKGQTA